MIETASKILFVLSSAALVPVMIALLVLAAWTVLLVGGLIREVVARVSTRCTFTPVIDEVSSKSPNHQTLVARLGRIVRAGSTIGFLPRYVRTCWLSEVTHTQAEKSIDEIELEMARRVSTLSLVSRLGPMLGLAGTLIPLGPGLVDLARGNTAGLANQLVIAFSTTVVGLLIGMVAFACAQLRRGWYAKDLSDVLFLEEIRRGQTGGPGHMRIASEPDEEWSMQDAH